MSIVVGKLNIIKNSCASRFRPSLKNLRSKIFIGPSKISAQFLVFFQSCTQFLRSTKTGLRVITAIECTGLS